jgi:hypothetical protein
MPDENIVRELVTYVKILIDYAQDHNKGVSAEQITRFHRARQASNGEELEILYNELAALVYPVTIDTLYATDDTAASALDELLADKKPTPTPREATKRALKETAWITAGLLAIVFLSQAQENFLKICEVASGCILTILVDTILDTLDPFTYGAIGACAYLLLEGHRWVWDKTFDANLIPRDRMKILIGALSGAIIMELVFRPQQTAGLTNDTINLGKAGLAFLAGYSTDFLFETIKRIIGAVLPRVEQVVVVKERKVGPTEKEKALKDLQASYNQETDPTKKQDALNQIMKKIGQI